MDLHAGPVGLAGHRAVRLEQVRDEFFLDHRIRIAVQQFRFRRTVVVHGDRQVVDDLALELLQLQRLLRGRRAQLHRHGIAGDLAEVFRQPFAQGVRVGHARLHARIARIRPAARWRSCRRRFRAPSPGGRAAGFGNRGPALRRSCAGRGPAHRGRPRRCRRRRRATTAGRPGRRQARRTGGRALQPSWLGAWLTSGSSASSRRWP